MVWKIGLHWLSGLSTYELKGHALLEHGPLYFTLPFLNSLVLYNFMSCNFVQSSKYAIE